MLSIKLTAEHQTTTTINSKKLVSCSSCKWLTHPESSLGNYVNYSVIPSLQSVFPSQKVSTKIFLKCCFCQAKLVNGTNLILSFETEFFFQSLDGRNLFLIKKEKRLPKTIFCLLSLDWITPSNSWPTLYIWCKCIMMLYGEELLSSKSGIQTFLFFKESFK